MDKLTPAQQRVLDAIKDFMADNNISPTYSNIAEKLGYLGTNGVCEIIHRLADKGYLMFKSNQSRSIVILDEPGICQYCRYANIVEEVIK